MTADDVANVAGRYLSGERRVVTMVGDATRIVAELEALGIGSVCVEKR